MADIKIKRTNTAGEYTEETTIEVTGLEDGTDSLTKSILEKLKKNENAPEKGKTRTSDGADTEQEATNQGEAVPGLCKLRRIVNEYISPKDFKAAIKEGDVDRLISPFDEIEIPLDTGNSITVVCGYSNRYMARFVMKDSWGECVMNKNSTNKGGYYKSESRKHVLEDIWPHIRPEWQAIIKPRTIKENIEGECVVYNDPMWVPSATDVFGPSEDSYWKDIDDGFQLPIFKKWRDRVKECVDEGTYPWWLRSAFTSKTYYFCSVSSDGGASYYNADAPLGVAPGFDIGKEW